MENSNPYETLYNQLIKIYNDRVINRENIVSIIVVMMQIIEDYKNLSGYEKKQTIINVLLNYVENTVSDRVEKAQILSFIKFTVPSLIDTIISVDKKELEIKTKNCFKKFFSCCFS